MTYRRMRRFPKTSAWIRWALAMNVPMANNEQTSTGPMSTAMESMKTEDPGRNDAAGDDPTNDD